MLHPTFRTDDGESFIVQDDENLDMGQVADLAQNRIHPPLPLYDLLTNGGGIWKRIEDGEEVPDLSHLAQTAFFDRSRKTLNQNTVVQGAQGAVVPSQNSGSTRRVGKQGATIDGAPQ